MELTTALWGDVRKSSRCLGWDIASVVATSPSCSWRWSLRSESDVFDMRSWLDHDLSLCVICGTELDVVSRFLLC